MPGLIEATSLEPEAEGSRVHLDSDWEIWGPAGGYLAAITLRAVREIVLDGHRPVTLTGQFVRVAKPGALDLKVEPIKVGASSLFSVVLSQDGSPVFLTQIWTTSRRDPSLEIQPVAPDLPSYHHLRDQNAIAAERGLPLNKFWKNLENRPVNFGTYDDPPPSTPNQYRWMRFRDWDADSDPFFDTMRTALLIDLAIWPGHWHRISDRASYLAPSLDLTVYFHTDEPAGEWLLSDAESDVSGEGLISGRVRVWSEKGRALATGSGHSLVVLPKEKR